MTKNFVISVLNTLCMGKKYVPTLCITLLSVVYTLSKFLSTTNQFHRGELLNYVDFTNLFGTELIKLGWARLTRLAFPRDL